MPHPVKYSDFPCLVKPYNLRDPGIILFIYECTDTLIFEKMCEKSFIFTNNKKNSILVLFPNDKIVFENDFMEYFFEYIPEKNYKSWLVPTE